MPRDDRGGHRGKPELTPRRRHGFGFAGPSVPTGDLEAASARSDLFERRRVLRDDWAAYLDRGPGPAASG